VTIAEFRKALGASPISSGASWLKADFHIHEPGSSDYEYKGADAASLLGAAISKNEYRFAVVLKHQEFPNREELRALQKSCPDTTLIPGAEINVFVEALFKKISKDYFFHCIVAVDPDSDGDFGYVLQKAKDEFSYKPGEYPAGFRSNILDLGRFFQKHGAIFIPAHLHQSKKPENSRSIDDLYDDDAFLGFVSDGAFDALEVRDIKTADFFTGVKTTDNGKLIPSEACVASSDAHHHSHIEERARATWIRAEKPSFDELKAALNFRHRVRLDNPKIEHARIVGVHVKGAFIPELWIPLNEGFNALIGSKGSGKTALVECIRFALNTHVPNERRDTVSRHIGHVLGSSGFVECLVSQSDGSELLITRRADSPDRITILDGRGDTRTVTSNDELAFPISILGWHEIEAVADQAEARISLLDRVGNAAEIRAHYEKIRALTEQARDVLPILQRQIKKLQNGLRGMWELQRKRATLQRLEQDELLSLQQQYEWFLGAEQKVSGLQTSINARSGQIPALIASNISLSLSPPPESDRSEVLNAALKEIEAALEASRKVEGTSITNLQSGLNDVSQAAQRAKTVFADSFSKFRDEIYTPRVNALPPEDREILTKQIQILEETKRLPLVEKQCSELLTVVKSHANQIKKYCDNIRGVREAIIEKRKKLVDELNDELPSVSLKFLPNANQNARDAFQKRYGEDGISMINYMTAFGKPNSYENLGEAFSRLSELELEQDKWLVDNALFDAKFVEMFDAIDEDDLEICLNVGRAGFVPIQNLSAGQRCVAVFPLLLRNTRGPLVIDQPEDNLDNRYIADIIGPDLLKQKQHQQFLVTSHNANLVVLTDADLIVHVDSDGAQASFPTAGFLACSSSNVRKSVLDVLDGGEEALTARQRKYGTRIEP
jgi:DNA repair ATPase RecN